MNAAIARNLSAYDIFSLPDSFHPFDIAGNIWSDGGPNDE